MGTGEREPEHTALPRLFVSKLFELLLVIAKGVFDWRSICFGLAAMVCLVWLVPAAGRPATVAAALGTLKELVQSIPPGGFVSWLGWILFAIYFLLTAPLFAIQHGRNKKQGAENLTLKDLKPRLSASKALPELLAEESELIAELENAPLPDPITGARKDTE